MNIIKEILHWILIVLVWVLVYITFQQREFIGEIQGAHQAKLSICESYLEDACTAIEADEDNIRTGCQDIKDAVDYGRGR